MFYKAWINAINSLHSIHFAFTPKNCLIFYTLVPSVAASSLSKQLQTRKYTKWFSAPPEAIKILFFLVDHADSQFRPVLLNYTRKGGVQKKPCPKNNTTQNTLFAHTFRGQLLPNIAEYPWDVDFPKATLVIFKHYHLMYFHFIQFNVSRTLDLLRRGPLFGDQPKLCTTCAPVMIVLGICEK